MGDPTSQVFATFMESPHLTFVNIVKIYCYSVYFDLYCEIDWIKLDWNWKKLNDILREKKIFKDS